MDKDLTPHEIEQTFEIGRRIENLYRDFYKAHGTDAARWRPEDIKRLAWNTRKESRRLPRD